MIWKAEIINFHPRQRCIISIEMAGITKPSTPSLGNWTYISRVLNLQSLKVKPSNSNHTNSNSKSLSSGEIAGIIVGSFAFVFLCLICNCYLKRAYERSMYDGIVNKQKENIFGECTNDISTQHNHEPSAPLLPRFDGLYQQPSCSSMFPMIELRFPKPHVNLSFPGKQKQQQHPFSVDNLSPSIKQKKKRKKKKKGPAGLTFESNLK